MGKYFDNGISVNTDITVTNGELHGLPATPSGPTYAASKAYVDAVARGLSWKDSVRVATTTNGTLATAFENGDTVDGVTLATGNRILLKNQSTASENGIYIVAASGAPSRASDFPSGDDADGVAVSVEEGSTNADKVFLQTANGAVGTVSQVWSQMGGGSTYLAGDGLQLSSSTFSILLDSNSGLSVSGTGLKVAASIAGNALTLTAGVLDVAPGAGLEISSDTIRIAASAAGAGLTGGAGSALAVGAGAGITVNADDVALAASVAGNALTLTAGVLDVVAGSGLEISSDTIRIAAAAAGAGLTGGAGSALAVGAGTGITVNADDVAIDTSYLDGVIDGKSHKKPVRATTTATLTISNPGTSTFDGITLSNGDRLLVKDQSTASQNGIYIFNGSGSALTRATDADASAEMQPSMLVAVSEGTLYADTVWMLTTNQTITLGSTSLAFAQVGVSANTAGDALSFTSGVLAVVAGSGLEISSDTIRIAAAAAGAGLTGGAGSALAVGAGAGITVNADDVALASSVAGDGLTYTTGVLAVGAGTGITVTANAVAIDTSVVVRKSAGDIGDGASTSIAYTHNLGTKDVTYSLRWNVDDVVFDTEVEFTDTNTITFTFSSVLTSNQARVVVHG